MSDKELSAMTAVLNALEPLDDKERTRVIDWTLSRFKMANIPRAKEKKEEGVSSNPGEMESTLGSSPDLGSVDTQAIAESFAQVTFKHDWEKVLVVAAFLKKSSGKAEMTAKAINGLLKELGESPPNITLAIYPLMKKKPKFFVQVGQGKSKFAEKKYLLTAPGLAAADQILTRGREDDSSRK